VLLGHLLLVQITRLIMKRSLILSLGGLILVSKCLTPQAHARDPLPVIAVTRDASWTEKFAARELRRFIYTRTGELCPLVDISANTVFRKPVIFVGRKSRTAVRALASSESLFLSAVDQLGAQSYWIKTMGAGKRPTLFILGGDDAGVLYGAYRFAEHLGIRFFLDNDVIPDQQQRWIMPVLDDKVAPLFALRGIQPFHDFPEGPDWWNRDDYLAVLGQLPKLRMNFFALHTYPEQRPNAEPTVWIGTPGDIGSGGRIQFSYPSSYMSTWRGNWGYIRKNTSDFVCGSAGLFERDDYGPEVMFDFLPAPATPESCNEVFNRTATMFRDAFTFARRLQVQTCVGTETPLIIPKLVQERLKSQGKTLDMSTLQELYEGIFKRASQAYSPDYYWFWTPENWTWSGVKEDEIAATTNDFNAALAAYRKLQPPFKLATCGWVLGPQQDRALFDKVLPKEVAVSCINRQVGYTPVEPGFAEIQGRGKWAIPWMEDDPALTSPQLWVGRMRRDAADSLKYGCDGLLGIHWRTRVLGPNVAALAQAAWSQKPWLEPRPAASLAPPPRSFGPVGGQTAAFPNNVITGTDEPTIYQTVRYNLQAYHIPASNGTCTVTLKFCEPHYDSPGQRIFDVKLQGEPVIRQLDILARAGKNHALDYTFTNVGVHNGWIDIGFSPRVEFPSIAAIVVQQQAFARKINCGGPAWGEYEADAPPVPAPKEVFPSTRDFYEDWAAHEFGPETGPAAAALFARVDCALPIPSFWVDGPGGIKPDPRPWEQVRADYAFVDEFAALRPQVRGPGNLQRFDYWLNTFLYFRDIAQVNCAWSECDQAMQKVKKAAPEVQKELARGLAVPARSRLVQKVNVLFEHLLATVSTPGELGTVANWNQHNLPGLLEKPGQELARILGENLGSDLQPSTTWQAAPRLIVPTKRTSAQRGEQLRLKLIVLPERATSDIAVHWKKLGDRRFETISVARSGRGVYLAQLPAAFDDFEYYVQAQPAGGKPLLFPATAPAINQTVIVCPD